MASTVYEREMRRADEGVTLETSVIESLYDDQFIFYQPS